MSRTSNIIRYQTDNMIYNNLNKDNNDNKDNKDNKDNIEKECIICFTPINNKRKLIQFSCGHNTYHTYHFSCFNYWCKQSNHVLDQCISCDTVREFIIIPKKVKKKTICFPCFIQ